MILPLAHHAAVSALPVFAPAVIIITVLTIKYLRDRRHWDKEP